jgi:hypothetical protein
MYKHFWYVLCSTTNIFVFIIWALSEQYVHKLVSDYCLTPNEQYEELDISKNSGKPYKNTNFDKEDILANHKSSWFDPTGARTHDLPHSRRAR